MHSMKLSQLDQEKIRNVDIVRDTTSYMFGHFKLPGNDTNDIVNNSEY